MKRFHWFHWTTLFLFSFSIAQAEVTLESLREAEEKIKKVAKKGMPATVAIIGVRGNGTGSGVIVDKSGLILTAAHVTQATGEKILVIFPDGKKVEAVALGANRRMDAGLAQITEEGEYPFVNVGSSEGLNDNDWCVSIGHAGGFEEDRSPPVRVGRIIRSGGRSGMLITDCTLIGGDSGGPLFDINGDVIGIHSSIGNDLAENRHVPIAVFKRDWDKMKAGETWGVMGGIPQTNPNRPMLGVVLNRSGGGKGVEVTKVFKNSPAEKAGVEESDSIVKIDGKGVTDYEMLTGYIRKRQPGKKVKVIVLRGEEEKELTVVLGRAGDILPDPRAPGERSDRKKAEPRKKPGNMKAPEGKSKNPGAGIKPGNRKKPGGDVEKPDGDVEKPEPKKKPGNMKKPDEKQRAPYFGVKIDVEGNSVKVREVVPRSPAARAGLMPGDIISAVDGTALSDREGLIKAVTAHQPGDKMEVEISRGGEKKEMNVKLVERRRK